MHAAIPNDRSEGNHVLTLAIDTSGASCAAGLFDGAREIARHVLDLGRGHADAVVDVCEAALASAGSRWSDIGEIVVTVGPGSFTGIRAGVAAARGFGLSLDVPVTGVSTLQAIAIQQGGSKSLLVALDARRGQVYAQGFDADGAPLDEPVVATPGAVAESMDPNVAELVGSGAAPVLDALRTIGRNATLLADIAQPDIAAVAACARAVGAALPPEPLYLRAADAKPAAPLLASPRIGESA